MGEISALDIVARFLIDNNYDGLVNPKMECGCKATDIRPCFDDFGGECLAANTRPCPSTKGGECDLGFDHCSVHYHAVDHKEDGDDE